MNVEKMIDQIVESPVGKKITVLCSDTNRTDIAVILEPIDFDQNMCYYCVVKILRTGERTIATYDALQQEWLV